MNEYLNNNSAVAYGMGTGYSPELQPMYSALASSDTIRGYQQRNNVEEAEAGLSWWDRLEAGYTGMAHGAMSYGPEQVYRSLRTLGKIINSDELQQFGSEGVDREKRMRELDPFYTVDDRWMQDGWGRSLYEGMRGITSSAYGMLPGAAISLLPGAQGIGLATLGAGAGGMAGLAEYDSFMEEAVEKFQGLNPALTREEIEDSVFWDAFYSGLAEGGTEAITDYFGGKLIGLVGKAGVKPAKHILDQLVRNVTKTMVTEAGGEVTTAIIQDYLREQAGLDYSGRVEAFKQALGPALVGGAAFGIGGTGLKLAQGKIHAEVDYNRSKADADAKKTEIDATARRLRQEFREAHYTPKAVEVYNQAQASGADHFQASTWMEAVENTAKAWAERTGNNAADWQGDAGKVLDTLKALEEHKAATADGRDTSGTAVSLDAVRELALSELTTEQQRSIAEIYGVETTADIDGNSDTVTLDTERLDVDLRQALVDPQHVESIPESARPVLEQMRDSVTDLYGLANRHGLANGFNPELSEMMGKAVEYRKSLEPPKPAAFIVQETDLDAVVSKYGDFSKLTKEQQSAFIGEAAKAAKINFDGWNIPTDQKGIFAILDTEMRPFLDKIMGRKKRSDKSQESKARAALAKDGINLERFAEFAAQVTGNGDIRESAAVKAREIQIAERVFLANAVEMGKLAHKTMAPADIVKHNAAMVVWEQTHAMLRAVRSEAGHFLRAFNFIGKDMDLSRMRTEQLFEATGGFDAAKHRLTALANAKTQAEQVQAMRDALRAKTTNMFIEYRTMNLLSSLKTHIVNVAGNAATLSNEIWNRWLAEKMGKGQGVVDGTTWQMIGGLWDGLKKVHDMWSAHKADQGGTVKALRNLKDMWGVDPASSLIGDAGMTQRSLTKENALDVIGGLKEKVGLSREHGIISNGLSTMVDYMGRVLGISGDILLAQDQFFKTIAAHAELAALNHQNATQLSGGDKATYTALMEQFQQNTPAEHKMGAMEFAKLVTFQSDLGKYAKHLDNARNKIPIARALVPFFKTPANIMKYAAAHTPGMAQLFGDIRNELGSPDIAKRHLAEARLMTGTLVWATSIGLAASGYLTGSGPADKDEREKARATGWQPNSLRIPGKDGEADTYIALDRLDPAAFILNTAASLVEIIDGMDGDDLDKAMWAGIGAAWRVAGDRTYLRSISDAVAAINDWTGHEGARVRQSFASSMIPASSMMRAVAQQVDPVQREIDGIFDAIRAGIPGMSEGLPVRRNFLGEAVTSDGYYGPDWLSPLRQSRDKQDVVYDEIYRLAKAGHKVPSMPDKAIRHQGQAVKMNGSQYSQFMELSGVGLKYGGKTAKERIAEAIQSQSYQNWDDEKKAKQIRSIIESYRGEARKKIKLEDPGIRFLLGIR